MIKIGTVQTTASTLLECDQFGLYFSIFIARTILRGKTNSHQDCGNNDNQHQAKCRQYQ